VDLLRKLDVDKTWLEDLSNVCILEL